MLEDMGADVVLNYSSDEFPELLSGVLATYKPSGYFTALSGEVASYIFERMADYSTLYIYGILSMEKVSLDCHNILFKFQKVDNYLWTKWYSSLAVSEQQKWIEMIAEDIEHKEGVFDTPIGRAFPIEEVFDAM